MPEVLSVLEDMALGDLPENENLPEDNLTLDFDYPKMSSDLFEQNLRRDLQEEGFDTGITPELLLAVDTADAFKKRNPGLFAEDEDAYEALAFGKASFLPEEERGKEISDEEILRRYLRNPDNQPMREGSVGAGFKKTIAPSAGGLAGFVAGAKAGYALQQPIPPTNPWFIGAKFLIPVATGLTGQVLGEEGVEELRDYFFGEPDLVDPRTIGMERVGETAAIGVSFAPLPFLTTKKALEFGATKYLDNVAQAKVDKLDELMRVGPLPKEAGKAAFAEAGKKGPRSVRGIAAAERLIGEQGARAAASPLLTTAQEAGFAAGMTGGRYLSEEYAGGEYALPAEIAGGFAGGISVPLVGGIPYMAVKNWGSITEGAKKLFNAVRGKDEGLKGLFANKDEQNAFVDVVNIIEERMIQAGEDPQKVANALEELVQNPQFKQFTAGTLAKSPTLLRIEHNMAELFPDLKEKGQAGLRSALDSYKQMIAAYAMIGDAAALREIEGAFQTTLENAFIQQLEGRANKVLAAAEKIGAGESNEAVGRALQENLRQSLTAARAKERYMYSQIPQFDVRVFRDVPGAEQEVGELRSIPNIFDFVEILPESRALLKNLPSSIKTQVEFLKEILEDAGIDVSRLGKRGAQAGADDSSRMAERINARIERLGQQRQGILDDMGENLQGRVENLLNLTSSSSRYPTMSVEDKLQAVRRDTSMIDDLMDATRGRRKFEDDEFRYADLQKIRKLLLNRLSAARAEQDLAAVGERVVQRSEADLLADEIVDLRALISELREAGEPVVLSSRALTEARTSALNAQRDLTANKQFNEARFAGKFAELVDQDLTGAIDEVAEEGARASLTAARGFSKALNDAFTRAAAPAGILGTRRGGAEQLPPERLVQELFGGRSDRTYLNAKEITKVGQFLRDRVNPDIELVEDLPAYIDVNKLVNDVPDILERALRNIRSVALDARGEGKDVVLNSAQLGKWLRDPTNQQLLAMFPKQLELDLKDADAAYELLMSTRKQAQDNLKEAQKRLAFTRLVSGGDETPSELIRGALGSSKPAFQLNEILRTINNSTVEGKVKTEAKESLKAGIIDWAMARASDRDGNLNPRRMFDSLFTPLSPGSTVTPADWLISNKLAGEQEMDAIKRYLAEMRNIQGLLSNNAMDELLKETGPLKDLALRIIGAKAGTAISGMVGGSEGSLIAASAGSKAMRALFLSKSGINNMNAFRKLLADPETLSKLLKTPRDKREAKSLGKIFFDWMLSKGFVIGRRGYTAAQEAGPGEFEQSQPQPPEETAPAALELDFELTPEERALTEEVNRMDMERERQEASPVPPMFEDAPVSILNNNPGNLIMAGQPGAVEGERGFAAFETPQAGLQALRRQVALDTQERGMTLRQFMNKYAPPSENDTEDYLAFISRNTGLDPEKRVPSSKIADLMRAIVQMEGGQMAVDYFYGSRMAEGERDSRPTAKIELPPLPTPQAAPAAAQPSPASRQQYAAMYPFETASELIRAGKA